jgi:hypothetical protein
VVKLPSSALALCGAWPVLRQVTVSPVSIVTVPGEKKKSPIDTLVDEAFRAFGEDAAGATAAGGAAGGLSASEGSAVRAWSGASPGVPAAAPSDDPPVGAGEGAGVGGSACVVVVVLSAGVPESCAAETAGAAQIAARTSIPLARALALFILGILRRIDP